MIIKIAVVLHSFHLFFLLNQSLKSNVTNILVMGLHWKKRTLVVMLVYGCYILALILSPLSARLETPLSTREVYFFDGDQYVVFELHNSTNDETYQIRLEGSKVNDTHTEVSITVDQDLIGSFWVSPEGWIYQNNSKQEELYSIWWIYVQNVMVFGGVQEGDSYSVMDPTGFFGNSSIKYQYEVIDKFVFYPIFPQHRNLSGAQASFEATLFSEETHQKHGSFIFDTTSGALEQADVVIDGHWCQILLVETSYEISRHRIVLLIFNVIIGTIATLILLLVNLIDKRKFKEGGVLVEKRFSSEFLALFGLGAVCTTLDIVDTWFYHGVGENFSIVIDVIYLILLALACKKWHYGYKWLFPALFEFIYAGPFRGRMMIPYMGTTLAWFAIIWASGIVFRRRQLIKTLVPTDFDNIIKQELNKWDHPIEKIL